MIQFIYQAMKVEVLVTDQLQIPTTVDLSKYIETRLMEKRPHIRGRRVPVALLAYSARTEQWNAADGVLLDFLNFTKMTPR